MTEDVLVIGAGPAGIACAYFLKTAGIPYKVVDQAGEIGATWNSLYPSLRLNTTRFYSHLPGRPFPLHYRIFPTGKQYHRYLVNYAKDHDLNIHLGVRVHRVYQEGVGWRVESSAGSAWYPAVISATGRFSTPLLPRIPGMAAYTGQIMHAHDYLGPAPFVGKRVMVVGNGPSGLDIASELGSHAAGPVLLAQRTGVVLRPIYPLGLPKHLWMLIAEGLPAPLAKRLLRAVNAQKFGPRLMQGIKTPPPHAASSAAGGTRGRALINAVRAGKVRCVDGPLRFEERHIVLEDGTQVSPEVVIMATGYAPVLYQYLDLPDAPPNAQGWPRRVNEPDDVYWQGDRQIAGYPGLYLVGVYYQGKGAMYNFNVEAAQAVEEIKGHLQQVKCAGRARPMAAQGAGQAALPPNQHQ